MNLSRQYTTIKDGNGNYIKTVKQLYPTDSKPESFLAADFAAAFPLIKFTEIIDIYVAPEYRYKGVGKYLLQEVIRQNQDAVILVAGGVSSKEYPEEPSEQDMIKIIDELEPFYLKNGFINVNDKLGGYQFKRAYMYADNSLGRFCIKNLYKNSKENKKYKVITLCGSTKFKDDFIKRQKILTLEGNIVISLGLFDHSGDNKDMNQIVKKMLCDMHLRKIDMADEIHVINKNGYIGESTASEIAYAKSKNIPVTYMEPLQNV